MFPTGSIAQTCVIDVGRLDVRIEEEVARQKGLAGIVQV